MTVFHVSADWWRRVSGQARSRLRESRIGRSLALGVMVILLLFGYTPLPVYAGPIADRITTFPDWTTKPTLTPTSGDLIYPDWFTGQWTLTSTLIAMEAPLAPEVTTPGFEGNRPFLNQPIATTVRFVPDNALARTKSVLPLLSLPTRSLSGTRIVADRALNGLNLAKAYLGDRVFRVWVDSRNPNQVITKFRDNRKLFSTVAGRGLEQPDATHFLTTEVFQQFFQSGEKPYKNEVETTTAYEYLPNGTIAADQITAVYLVPPHPRAYLAGDRPVALYRYRLTLTKVLNRQ